MTLCKIPQLPPVPALFPGAVIPTAHQEQAVVVAEGHALLCLVHIHAVHIGGVFQGDDVGTVLVEFQEIPAVLIQEREVRGHDDPLRLNPPLVCHGHGPDEFPHGGVFIDVQSPGDPGEELQGMELGLAWEPDGPGHREGQGKPVRKFCGISQLFQGGKLSFDFPAVIQRVHIGGLFFKVAVYAAAQLPVFLKGRFVGAEVLFCPVKAECTDQLIIDQSVLGCDFGGGMPGDAAAQGLCLRKHIGDAGLMQQISAQNSRHAAADDQHMAFDVPIQLRKSLNMCGPLPQ